MKQDNIDYIFKSRRTPSKENPTEQSDIQLDNFICITWKSRSNWYNAATDTLIADTYVPSKSEFSNTRNIE